MVAGDNPLGCATRKMPLVVIMGASGTGKSTICDNLAEHYGLVPAPTYTTRAKRSAGETGHTFLSEQDFLMLPNKVAVSEFAANLYCFTQEQADKYDTVTLDPHGLLAFRKNYKGCRKIYVVYLTASKETRAARMICRGGDEETTLSRISHDDKAFSGAEMLADLIINTEGKSPLTIAGQIAESVKSI